MRVDTSDKEKILFFACFSRQLSAELNVLSTVVTGLNNAVTAISLTLHECGYIGVACSEGLAQLPLLSVA
jgi:hypothetical protein